MAIKEGQVVRQRNKEEKCTGNTRNIIPVAENSLGYITIFWNENIGSKWSELYFNMTDGGLPAPAVTYAPPNDAETWKIPGAWLVLFLNWFHITPKFSGKTDEDAEAHLVRTADQMNIHPLAEGVKVQHFCLTSGREVRMWYKSLRQMW